MTASPHGTFRSFGTGREEFVLSRGSVDGGKRRSLWYLNNRTATSTACVDVYPAYGSDEEAARKVQIRAHDKLRTLGVRLIRWEPTGDGEFRAVTGRARGGWHVTTYHGTGGTVWRRGPDDTWIGPGDTRYTSVAALNEAEGPITVGTVHNIAALLEELRIFEAMTVYFWGDTDCHEGDCDGRNSNGDVVDDEGRVQPDRKVCLHVEEAVATAAEAMAFHRIGYALRDLESMATVPDDKADRFTRWELARRAGIREAIAAVREAMRTDDD